ncbi:MAG: flagellar hook protein FlgE [Pseudomonadales bacterium]
MPFNTALSGLRAASTDLEITGNNIANSATIGFKESRAEFADIYAASFVSGGNGVGSGVVVQDISQSFGQGTISFSDNALDLAVNGGGFFVLADEGTPAYTRAGIFSIDKEGFVTNNSGMRLQGQLADTNGVVSGEPTDLLLNTRDISPQSTTRVNETFNLDAAAPIPEEQTQTITVTGIGVQDVQQGSDNGYLAGTIDINGVTQNIPSADNMSALAIAGELSAIDGVDADAQTTATLTVDSAFPIAVNELLINGVSYTGTSLAELASDIDATSNLDARVVGTDIEIVAVTGANLEFDVAASIGSGTQLTVASVNGQGAANQITIDEGDPALQRAVVGGVVTITADSLTTTLDNPVGTNVFNTLTPVTTTSNSFDPDNPASYNSVTSFTIFDTEGISHNVTQYFTRVLPPAGPNSDGTLWNVVVRVDGRDVGGTDPLNPEPATFELHFNADGSYDRAGSTDIVIDNWIPLDSSGLPNGALGPSNDATLPIPEPATSSNFLIDVSNATSFGGGFSVSSLNQNGFAKGSLTGVEVAETGTIFARYSNGETQSLGQLQLATFPNFNGLTPLGDSVWGNSIDSGQPILGVPGSGQFGAIQAGALEDSNVDLTEQLVNLILAQRNFQANAKTIETADSVTQTIINLR